MCITTQRQQLFQEVEKGVEVADTLSITSYCERLAGPEVQLKPPAMKNELNAAIRFIKFVK